MQIVQDCLSLQSVRLFVADQNVHSTLQTDCLDSGPNLQVCVEECYHPEVIYLIPVVAVHQQRDHKIRDEAAFLSAQ